MRFPQQARTRIGALSASRPVTIARELRHEIATDNLVLLSGGVAFFAFLSVVPAFAATIAIWGIVAEPSDVTSVVENLASSLPPSAQDTIEEQLRTVSETSGTGLGITAFAGIVASLWSASTAMKHLFQAVRSAYDEPGTASYLRQRGLALLFTIGAILFSLLTATLIAVLPAALASTDLGTEIRTAASWLRWPVLALSMMLALAILYHVAPRQSSLGWKFVSPGTVFATLTWLLGSAGFAWYSASFGNFSETYGSTAGVIVLMLWLFLTAFVVILGAELNACLDRLHREDANHLPTTALAQPADDLR